MNDYEIAKICCRLYADDSEKDKFWDRIWTTDGSYAAVKFIEGKPVLVFRGSSTAYDWYLNFKADPERDGSVGWVPRGFGLGFWPIQDEVMAFLRGSTPIVTGHSRGAAIACVAAGIMKCHGITPSKLVIMGCPRPGEDTLRSILSNVPVSNYKNGSDPVTDVPFYIDLPGEYFDAKYVEVRDFIQLNVKVKCSESWPSTVEYHHYQNYLYGIGQKFLPENSDELWYLEHPTV